MPLTTCSHTARFTLTRDTSGVILELTIDGTSRALGEDSTLILPTFNELAFENKTRKLDYLVDNVNLEIVPEPGRLALFALAAAACLWKRLVARARKLEGFALTLPPPDRWFFRPRLPSRP